MEVKVGIRDIAREVVLETKASASEIEEALSNALATGGLLTLTDEKGRKVLIPSSQVAYIDLGTEHARQIGFGAVAS